MRNAWVVVAVVNLVVGCTSGGAMTPVMQQPDSGQPVCAEGVACTCTSGLQGVTRCNQVSHMYCDCSPPCEYPPHTAPAFTACGGDPTGAWNLKETDSSQRVYHLQTSILGPDVACDAFDFLETPASAFALTLSPGGSGFYASTTGATTFKVTDACARATFGESNGQACQAAGCVGPDTCGMCSCSRAGGSTTSALTWTHTETELSYTIETAKQTVRLQYCVDGNKLALLSASKVILRFER